MIEAVSSERLGLPNPMLSTGSPQMPLGLIHTRISVEDQPGEEVAVQMYLTDSLPNGSLWYETDSATGTMRDASAYAQVSTDRKSVTLTVRDGGPGDADGIANGIIVTASGAGCQVNLCGLYWSSEGWANGPALLSLLPGICAT